MGAWLSSLGDHPHVPVIRELLATYDEAVAGAEAARREASALNDELSVARRAVEDHRADADRLVAWIVAHGHTGGDPTAVLTLHDRMPA